MFGANSVQVNPSNILFLASANNTTADRSQFANPLLTNNNISFTTDAKFGSHAFYQPATNPAAYINWTANFSIAANEDFGMDCWWSPYDGGLQMSFMGLSAPGVALYLGRDNSRGPYLANESTYITSGYGVPRINGYAHYAFEVYNGTVTSYVNGTPYQSTGWTRGFPSGTTTVFALAHWGSQYDPYTSAMDEIRVYRGAIYKGASFTPPTAPYSL